MNTRNILVICPDRRTLGDLVPLLSQSMPQYTPVEIGHYPSPKDLTPLLKEHSPSLCFLDLGTDRDKGLSLLTAVSSAAPGVGLVTLLRHNDPDLILTCLRQGASEFLLQPLTKEQIQPMVDRIASSLGTRAGSGARVVVAMPVKGACGASTVATNLAHWLRKMSGKRILLADLDPTTATISFLLKVKSNYSFLDALSRAGTLDADLWKGLVTTRDGVDVLLAPENPMDASIELPDPVSIIDFCRQLYDFMVVDTGNAFSSWNVRLAGAADDLLLITTNELPALRATQRVLQNLDRNHVDRGKVRLLVNRYSPDVGLTREAIETALHTDVFMVLPSDYDGVQRALMEGRQIPSGSAIGKSLIQLSERLGGKADASDKPKKKSSGWTSIFGSLVSRSNA